MEPITFKNSPLHHNDMVVRAKRQEVIEDLFPEAAQAVAQNFDRNLRLGVEAVVRYRHQVIRMIHHELGEEHPGLTFSVNFGLAPRSFDTLSEACECIDGYEQERLAPGNTFDATRVTVATPLRRLLTSNR